MASELGQYYIQIVPSAKGISGAIQNAIGPESDRAGESAGSKIANGIKGAIAAAGIGAALKSIISEGASLEQSIGGIDTLFKESSQMIQSYAKEAYRTVGLSANDYMEQVTSFSASLLQSMGGDTQAAAEAANMAMVDMGDNANKMGTNMQDIQNAYQGFAKQNYTMLDNLKLGYGGTKTEMERLLADATAFSGIEYNIDSLDDVYTAIHVIQEEMDIAGTTAKEASETIAGSFAALKGSFQNVLGDLALGNDMKPAMTALAQTLSTFLFDNLIPMVGDVILALPQAIMSFIQVGLPTFLEAGASLITSLSNGISTGIPIMFEKLQLLLSEIFSWLQEQLPTVLASGVEFITNFASGFFEALPSVLTNIGQILSSLLETIFTTMPSIMESGYQLIVGLAEGIWSNMPAIIEKITGILSSLLQTILEHFPGIVTKGFELIGKLASGLWENLPGIINTMGDLLISVIGKIGEYFPEFIDKGFDLILELAQGLVDAIPKIVAKVPEIMNALKNKFFELKDQLFSVGEDIVMGLWNGISSVKRWLLDKISGFVDSVTGGIKEFFGINSPSRVMADEVGKFLPAGLAIGIEGNLSPVKKAMDEMGYLATGTIESKIASMVNYTRPSDYIVSGINPSTTDIGQDILNEVQSGFKQLMNKNFDVYIDGRIASVMLAPTMSRELQKNNTQASRRKGIIGH